MNEGARPAPPTRTTFHLTPDEVWEAQAGTPTYTPEAFGSDGFIHCADGEANLLAVANAFYQGDTRPFLVLSIDLDRLAAEVRYEDPNGIYPHIYGPLNQSAVVDVRRAIRLADGSFAKIE